MVGRRRCVVDASKLSFGASAAFLEEMRIGGVNHVFGVL